eukprot:969976-Amorphochlora_amoeboformis.AAC.2
MALDDTLQQKVKPGRKDKNSFGSRNSHTVIPCDHRNYGRRQGESSIINVRIERVCTITNGQYKGKWVEARILRPSGNYYVVQVEKTPLAMKAGLNKKELNVQGFVLKPRRLQAPSAPAPQAPPRPPPGVPPGPKARAPAPPAGRPPSARPPQPPTTAAPPRQAISVMCIIHTYNI